MEAHTEGMQRSKVAGLVVALIILLVGVPALVWANSSGGDDHHRPGVSRMHDEDRGHGPPFWAHGQHAKPDKGAANAWQELTPQERSTLMRTLAREHRKCMLAGDECVAAPRDVCDHPLPPGLAKRR
jgi:nitrogen fixation-related uncharacterized protein